MRLRLAAAVVWFSPILAAIGADEPAKSETTSGVITEVRPAKNGILFRRLSELSFDQREVTDYQIIAPDALIILDGRRVKLSDLRPGDRVRMEINKKTSKVSVVTALTVDAIAKLKQEAEKAKEFERRVEERHLQMLRDEAKHQAEQRAKALAEQRAKLKEKLEDKTKEKKNP